MPIRCFYSLNPGEAIVAEHIVANRDGADIFFPHKDTGVDLVVFTELERSTRRSVTLQVKESRYFGDSHSWHQVRQGKIEGTEGDVDFFVFVTYRQVPDRKRTKWHNEFVVVPTRDLGRLVKKKRAGKNKVYSFYFAFEDDKVWDVRESRGRKTDPKLGAVDYTQFHNAWDLLWTN
jgi:hypothetical protein